MGRTNNRSFISTHFHVSAYFLTVWTYKRTRLTTWVYGMSRRVYYPFTKINTWHTIIPGFPSSSSDPVPHYCNPLCIGSSGIVYWPHNCDNHMYMHKICTFTSPTLKFITNHNKQNVDIDCETFCNLCMTLLLFYLNADHSLTSCNTNNSNH